MTFRGPPSFKADSIAAIHLDGDRSNNHIENLKWHACGEKKPIKKSAPEEWRNVPGFEFYIQVSSFGRVHFMQSGQTTWGSLPKDRKESPYVCLHRKPVKVNKLVAAAFMDAELD